MGLRRSSRLEFGRAIKPVVEQLYALFNTPRGSSPRSVVHPGTPPHFRIERVESRVLFAAVSWDGGGDGTSWGDRFNWSADALPGSNDDVTINVAANPTVTVSTGSLSI